MPFLIGGTHISCHDHLKLMRRVVELEACVHGTLKLGAAVLARECDLVRSRPLCILTCRHGTVVTGVGVRFGSELITLHSHTPLRLLDEGILADGRLVFASVPHDDGSHATVLVDCLALCDVQDSAFCFSDEQWEISIPCRIRGSGCHVEGIIHRPDR